MSVFVFRGASHGSPLQNWEVRVSSWEEGNKIFEQVKLLNQRKLQIFGNRYYCFQFREDSSIFEGFCIMCIIWCVGLLPSPNVETIYWPSLLQLDYSSSSKTWPSSWHLIIGEILKARYTAKNFQPVWEKKKKNLSFLIEILLKYPEDPHHIYNYMQTWIFIYVDRTRSSWDIRHEISSH